MHDAKKDSARAIAAAKIIVDDRHPLTDRADILVTLDHVIAAILVVAMEGDTKNAIAMLHEGVVPHVEERIMLYAARP